VGVAVEPDEEAMRRKLEEISYPVPVGLKRVPWIETMAVVSHVAMPELDSNDDVKREKEFHDICLQNTIEGLRRLKMMGVPFTRPDDFMAEMFKDDRQMTRVRAKIADEQARVRAVDLRKKAQEAKKKGRRGKGKAKRKGGKKKAM